jgi:3-hydroxyacyl-CoA dehydrogenase / enoyl-CoA hydratase / 3-hydroxybutyryl-CoA epimerase
VSAIQPAPLVDRAAPPTVTVDARRDGVAIVTVDGAHREYGALAPSFGAQLASAADRIEQDASIAAAVLVIGRVDIRTIGADVAMLKAIKFASDAERLARDAGQLLHRVEQLRKPLVAAVQGPVFGGAFELALSCRAIVATDDDDTAVGFRDIPLGLIPAANGMLRTAQRAGLRVAIELALGAKRVPASRAYAMGLVDDVCPRSIVLDVASRRAKALVGHAGRGGKRSMTVAALALDGNPVGRALVLRQAREQSRAKTFGHYPAPERALDVLDRFVCKGFHAAADLEAKVFGELLVSETAHRLLELHCATTALETDPGSNEVSRERGSSDLRGGAGASAHTGAAARIGVIGGGLIGSGIALITISAGASVRLKEKDDAALGRALRTVKGHLDAQTSRKECTALERDHVFARLSATTDYSGLRHAELVIEAVVEDISLKQTVVRDLEALVGPTCVLASSTSSIPIATIGQVAKKPERVLGMHYFSPVARMPLLEVVRADKTESWAVSRAVALGRRQDKTVIVVKDGPGFYTTRVLVPFLHEAGLLLGEGVAVEAIDHAMADWGFPVGPLRLLDEVGIDVAGQVAHLLHGALGERMAPPRAIGKLAGDERKGRKNGRGVYRYDERGREGGGRRTVDASVYALLDVLPTTMLPVEEIQMRCALSMINESIRCFGEGIIRGARDGDVGAVLGLGFPPFRGGPFRYVDTIGAAEALRRVQSYADRFGERWRPAPLLVHMARKGERFYG